MGIVDRFEKVTGTPLSSGLKILFKCSVRFHAQYGLPLEITDIDPAYTLGDMSEGSNTTTSTYIEYYRLVESAAKAIVGSSGKLLKC